jgi:hypothetical protein
MKMVKSIMATTHVDLHGDMLTKEALEEGVEQLKNKYIPLIWNHDIRYPPIGRVVSGEVIKLPDGHFALEANCEIFEESDSIDILTGDGREIPLDYTETSTFRIQFDRTFMDEDGQLLIQHLHELSGVEEKPAEFVKKALEPIQVLLIASGVYVIGSIAQGFLRKLGSDIYEKIRDALIRYYRKKKTPDSILDFCFYVNDNGKQVEVHILISNPTDDTVAELLDSQFAQLDRLLASVHQKESQVSSIVLEYKNKNLSIRYAVRNDAVPLTLRSKGDADGSGS